MADAAAGGVVVADLDHQLRPQLDPLQLPPPGPAARLGGARFARLQRRKHRPHAAFGRGAEAGDMADRAQLAAVVEAEDQRADRPLLFARPPAHHHAVDRPLPLYLRHPLAFAGDVGGTKILRHHALDRAQPLLRLRLVRGERGQLEAGLGGNPLQPLAPLPQRRLEQRLVALGEQVEGDIGRRDFLAQQLDPALGRVDPLLQQVELDLAGVAADNQLAVQHPAPRRPGELREVARQRFAAARLHVGLVAVDEDDRAEAVELRLVRPLPSARQGFAGQRQLRFDRRRERQGHRRQANSAEGSGGAVATRG